MRNPIRLLQAAVLISSAVILILIFQVKPEFPYVTPFYAKLLGIPAVFLLTIFVFWIGSWRSPKSIIYGALILGLALELIPLGLFLGNSAYPSSYYIDPQGNVVLSSFPGNVFNGKLKGAVNDNVIAAYDWQQGRKHDSAGKPLLFYREKGDGTVLVYDHPVENGEILQGLNNAVLEKFEAQQISRAQLFLQEGDLSKAKEILDTVLRLDPYADAAYRLNQIIKQREDEARAEEERQAAEAEAARLEAERAEAQQVQEEGEEEQSEADALSESDEEEVSNNLPERPRKAAVANHYRRRSYPRYNVAPDWSSAPQLPPPPQYSSAPRTAPRSTYYPQPQAAPPAPTRIIVRAPATPSPVIVLPSRTVTGRPTQSVTTTDSPRATVTQPDAERKKGMSVKKKLIITGAIAGGILTTWAILKHRN